MKNNSRSEAAMGSITPQLEGASRSTTHSARTGSGANPKPKEGGRKHE